MQKCAKNHNDIIWHFIGPIYSSEKAQNLVKHQQLHTIESIDSISTAKLLNSACSSLKTRDNLPPINVLIQVLATNSWSHTTGSSLGATQYEALDIVKFIRDECRFLKFTGIMSMGEIGDIGEFRCIRALKWAILGEYPDVVAEEDFVISMGNQQDYELAIIEGGSTQIRLTTTQFEPRPYAEIKSNVEEVLKQGSRQSGSEDLLAGKSSEISPELIGKRLEAFPESETPKKAKSIKGTLNEMIGDSIFDDQESSSENAWTYGSGFDEFKDESKHVVETPSGIDVSEMKVGDIVVKPVEAVFTRDLNQFFPMNPYYEMRYKGVMQTSEVSWQGGTTPKYDEQWKYHVGTVLKTADPRGDQDYMCRTTTGYIWFSFLADHELIGQIRISVEELATRPGPEGHWYDLETLSAEVVGKMKVLVEFKTE